MSIFPLKSSSCRACSAVNCAVEAMLSGKRRGKEGRKEGGGGEGAELIINGQPRGIG